MACAFMRVAMGVRALETLRLCAYQASLARRQILTFSQWHSHVTAAV
jgi:hypothetical protein